MLLLVFLVLFYASGSLGGSMQFKDDKYKLDYKVITDQDMIEFKLEVKTLGWLGLGLCPGKTPKMIGSDYFLASVVDGEFVGGDYHLPADATSRMLIRDPEESQDWDVTSFKEKNGKTFVTVKRLLDTGDSKHDYPINNSPLSILWAYSPNNSDTFAYHASNVGSQFVNLFGRKSGASSSMPKASKNMEREHHKKYKEVEE